MSDHHHLRFHREHQENAAHPFGPGVYGRFAEGVARSMGTPQFLISQTGFLIVWILLNGVVLHGGAIWDVYPFILLNLMLSFQAAYAAPLILVASNRQGERDALRANADAEHREDVANRAHAMLEKLTELLAKDLEVTVEVRALSAEMAKLTQEVHHNVCSGNRSV